MNAAGFSWIFSLIVKHLRELGVKLVTKNDFCKHMHQHCLLSICLSTHVCLLVGHEGKTNFKLKNRQLQAIPGPL